MTGHAVQCNSAVMYLHECRRFSPLTRTLRPLALVCWHFKPGLNEASAKIRAAGVADDEEDYALPIWAGVIPMRTVALEPEPDPRNLPDLSIPDHVSNCRFGQAGN